MKTKIKSIALFLALPALICFFLGASAHALPIPPEGQAVVTDVIAGTNIDGAVFIVNLNTGDRILVSDFGDPSQGLIGAEPIGIALLNFNTALVADERAGTNSQGALFRVNLRNGNRILISDFGDPAQGPLGQRPIGVTLNSDGNALVVDHNSNGGPGGLYLVDLTTGQRTLISDFSNPAQGPLGGEPNGVVTDGSGGAYVTDESPADSTGILFHVDLTSGFRTIISDFGNPAQGPVGQAPFSLILNDEGNALVSDEDGSGGPGRLFLVDLSPGPNLGDRTLISDFDNPAQGPTGVEPQGITLDNNGQALVVDESEGTNGRGVLFLVDTTSGDRTILSDFGDPSQGPTGSEPRGITFRAAPTARPIPTLSEWGLIATAAVLGLAGLYAVRRRRATA